MTDARCPVFSSGDAALDALEVTHERSHFCPELQPDHAHKLVEHGPHLIERALRLTSAAQAITHGSLASDLGLRLLGHRLGFVG